MNCETVRDAIHELFDDDPAMPLGGAVEAHLASCAECREFLAEMTALRSALRALPREPLPSAVLDGVWRDTVRARRVALWRAAAAAVVVTALGAGTYFVSSRPSGPSQAELARAEAQAELVFGYTARALAATHDAAARNVIERKVSPAVRGETSPRTSRRSS